MSAEVSYSCTRSRYKDLIKARREALASFVAQRRLATCPLHTALCETNENRISSALARVYAGWKKRGSRGRNKRLSIPHVCKQFSLNIVRLYDQRRRNVSVKYLIAFAIERTKWCYRYHYCCSTYVLLRVF